MKTTLPNWVRMSSIMLASLSFVIGMAVVAWYEIGEVQGDTPLATTVAIIVKGQAVSVLAAALGGVVEGSAYIVVIASYMVQKSRREGHAEGLAEGLKQGRSEGRTEGVAEGLEQGMSAGMAAGMQHGRTQGHAEGIAEAYADANEQNAAYFRRMKAALERGEDFDEPPPTFGNNTHNNSH